MGRGYKQKGNVVYLSRKAFEMHEGPDCPVMEYARVLDAVSKDLVLFYVEGSDVGHLATQEAMAILRKGFEVRYELGIGAEEAAGLNMIVITSEDLAYFGLSGPEKPDGA